MIKRSFSIIVPCYNAAKYVSETIESVLGQDYDDWELILINDGSKDATLSILQSYARKDDRIKVYDIKNGGVSKARNYGMSVALGDWIMFLDSDDWLEQNALSSIDKYRNKYPDCDVFGFNHYYNSENKQWKRQDFKPSLLKRCGQEIEWFKLDTMFPYFDSIKNKVSTGAIRGVWGKAIRKSIIVQFNLKFIENLKISEDAIFCLELFDHCKEVVLFNEYLIHYRIHSSSAMNKYSSDVLAVNEMALGEYFKRRKLFTDQEKFNTCYMGMVSECLFRTFKLYLLHDKCEKTYKEKVSIIREFVNSETVSYALGKTSITYLPAGKKQLVYCAKHKLFFMMFVIAYFSLIAIKLKK